MFLDRYLIFVSISFYLILSISSAYILSQSKYKLLLPGILVLLFAFTFNPNIDNKRHVRETVEKVRELKDPKTKVLICPQYFIYNFAYYYSDEIFKEINFQDPYYQIKKNLLKENIYTINNINEVNLENCNKVVFVDAAAQFSFPENNILNRLKKEYKQKNTHKYYEIFNVYEFDKK